MNNFLCPKCLAHICVGNHLIFKVKNQKKQSGLLLLDPNIGNYSSIKHTTFEIMKGEMLDFYCPVCGASLESGIHRNLAHVVLDENGRNYDVYFSQVSGEHSTFETLGDSVRATGEDAGKYTYFKVGDKFKKYL
jgi:predicted RNA-binding Zn-ribbon protein involved in translation (DUF1610 family)